MRGRFASDLTGNRFGRLTVIGRAPNQVVEREDGKRSYRAMWHCQCDCGSPVKTVRGTHLLGGKIIGCGCVGYENAIAAKIKHNQSRTRLYGVWRNIKNRCCNLNVPSYKNYGGRGISICDEWMHDFKAFSNWAFANGYNKNAKFMECTIDRIDNDGPYAPWNCRFATAKEQAANRIRRAQS